MPTTSERGQGTPLGKRIRWRVRALIVVAALGLAFRLYTAQWAGDWGVVRSVPVLHRLQIDFTGASGQFLFFTSSVEPNFLCLAIAPNAAVPGGQFWILHRDRLVGIGRPADFKPSPNWLANASTDSTGRQTSHDPRRACDFELSFEGRRFRRPVLTLFRSPADSPGWLGWRDSYVGKSVFVVRRTGAAEPALVLEQSAWNVESRTRLIDAAHYDEAFGIMVVPTRIAGQTFLLVLDVNDLNGK